MKVILSRKGFDSSNGGIASPIMPDGTLLSMPIPSNDSVSYSDIAWNGIKYSDILKDIAPGKEFDKCHLDPDIRDNRIKKAKGWCPAFGQTASAQGVLSNAGVEVGDIFLFLGWFRQIEKTNDGYRYARRNPYDFYNGSDLQIVYGYMQIGEIINDQDKIKKYSWHPHSSSEHTINPNNTLYLPSEHLSILPDMKGVGTFNYRKDRVLTMEGMGRATWNEYEFLMPEHLSDNRKNSAKGKGLYYCGIWQEMVVYESEGLIEWVKDIIRDTPDNVIDNSSKAKERFVASGLGLKVTPPKKGCS